MAAEISHPVGPWEDPVVRSQGGNVRADVLTVQNLLLRASNQLGHAEYSPGTANGTIVRAPDDCPTLNAIGAFQSQFLRHPDRRIDVGGRSWRRLRRFDPERAASSTPATVTRRGVILSPRNNRAGKSDATGAFLPGARTFRRIHGMADPVLFTQDTDGARQVVLDAIASAAGPLEAVAIFCHGTTSGLSSARIRARHVDELAAAIRGNSTADCKIVLYACSTGAPGGFASRLARELNGREGSGQNRRVVFGHTAAGHAFYFPFVRKYPPDDYVVAGGSPLFPTWRQLLRSEELWAHFPFMTDEELVDHLEEHA